MIICLKVKTLDSQTYDFSIDNEITVRQFKEAIAEKTNISADLQRIIYCGRVLSDEKLVKEYDVNGKVVHVVERPPPSSRGTTNTTDTNNRRQRDELDANIRQSPIFRALDGMVVGAMTIPVTTAGGQTPQAPIPPLNPSSSFCMNRITVARHMLECANNIALYLENPERGLNNSSLDILTQGRWTMESTVFEVGISAAVEIPQNHAQNLVGALRGAVSAALQNGHPNVTVVQLPTVFGSPQAGENQTSSSENSTQSPESSSNAEESDINIHIESSSTENVAQEPTNREAGLESNSNTNPSWQRTSTRTLGEVVRQMRTVQNRLEPFIQQYYDILMDDPVFEENDTTGRENSQRVFDRVSEALHYMSHAQHAISDLMLDLSQPAPRYLCCRPILVEQGVRSNNYLASFLQPSTNNNDSATNNNSTASQTSNASARPSAPPMPSATENTEDINADSQTTASAQPQTTGVNTASAQGQSQTQTNVDSRGLRNILTSPLFMPMRNRSSTSTTASTNASSESSNTLNSPIFFPMRNRPSTTNNANDNAETANQANPQYQVARLIQAVVNSAPLDADLHVQINAPNFLGFGMPINTTTVPQQNQTTPPSNSTTANSSSDSNSEANQPRVTTATHPTTSTQTRSTARPQVHIANLPSAWNARVIPANMLSSFDRFLPCSSHHIRENETAETTNQTNGLPRTRVHTRQRRQPTEATASSPRNTTPTSQPTAPSGQNIASDNIFNFSNEEFNIPLNLFGSNLTLRDLVDVAPSPDTLNRIRSELHAFIVSTLFAGSPITDENMNNAINQVIQLLNDVLIFLPQYDLPDYDARASVENFIRNSLPFIINLIREDDSNEFGTRLLRELISFVRRLFVILVTCVGRSNAELYLNQVAQMAITSNNELQQEVLRPLHRHLMAAAIRELDNTRQNTNDVQEFLVIRRPPTESQTASVTPMETDETGPSNVSTQKKIASQSTSRGFTGTSQPSLNIGDHILPPRKPTHSNEPLPYVVPESESWHFNFPTNWLPMITRDMETQRRQKPQAPYSDAYISGMSAKRRKMVQSSKLPTDVETLLTEGVKKVIESTGIVSNELTAEEISTAIGTDPAAQLSYKEALRTSICQRLRTDSDYSKDKFPNCSTYFTK